MEDPEGVERLFLELASESRLGILRELLKRDLRTQEIARRLDLTATEAVRQLRRLSEASLVQRKPDGSYTVTEYGRLELHLISSSEFAFRHREYFLNHDVSRLPHQFVNRIGELSQTELRTDTIENFNKVGRMFSEAEEYVWAIGEQALASAGQTVNEKVRKGVKFRFLTSERLIPTSVNPPALTQNVEVRSLSDIPTIMAITDKEAVVCFRLIGGGVDYVGFYGMDPTFLSWAKDVFFYYWEEGKLV
ncbi:MAG TPA: hypothetical protein VMS77_06725 [Conexivisphaerales archaeon]|nr:hypothetical protein [Conexivisphaerales archaeon]